MSETLSQDPDGLGVAYTTLAPSYPSTPATPSSTVQDAPPGANLPPFSTFSSDMDSNGTFSSVSDRLFSDTRLLDISNWDYYTETRLIERGENGLSIITSQPQYRPWESKPLDATSAFAGTTQANTFTDAFSPQNGAPKLPSFQSQFQAFSDTATTTEPTLTTLTNLTPVSPNSSSSPQSQTLTPLSSSFHTLSAVNPRGYPLVPAPIQAREVPSIQQQFLDERHIQLYSHPTANLTLNNTIHSASIFPTQNGAIIQNSQIISSPTVVTLLKSEPDIKLTTNLTPLHQTSSGLKLQNIALHHTQFQNPMSVLDSDAGLYNGIDKKINGTSSIMTSPTRNDFRKKERRKIRANSLESSAESDGNSNMDLGSENSGQVAAVSSTDGFKNHHGMAVNMEHEISGGSMDKQVKKKRKRCGECVGCQKKDNCGDCAPCRNDKSHQICKLRRCEKLTEKKSLYGEPYMRGESRRGRGKGRGGASYRGRKPNGPITSLSTGGIPAPTETNGGVPSQQPPSRPSPQPPSGIIPQPMPVQQQPMTPMPFYADPNRFPTPVWQTDPSQVSGWQGQFIQQIPTAGQPIDTYQQYPNGIYQTTYQQPAFESNTFYTGAVQVLTPTNARPPSAPNQQAQMIPQRPNSNYAHTPSPGPAGQQAQQQNQQQQVQQQQTQQQQNSNRQYQEYNQFGSNASNEGSQSRPSSVNSVINQNPTTPNSNYNQGGQQANQTQQSQQQQQTVYTTVSAANFSPSSNQQQTQFVNANSGNGQPGYPQVNASSPQVVSHNSSGYSGNEQFSGQQTHQQWQQQDHQQIMWEQQHQVQQQTEQNNHVQYMTSQQKDHSANNSPTKMQNDNIQRTFSQADKVNLNTRIKTMILNKQQNDAKMEQEVKNVEQNNTTGHFLWYSHHHHLNPLSVDGGPPQKKLPNRDNSLVNISSNNTQTFSQSNFKQPNIKENSNELPLRMQRPLQHNHKNYNSYVTKRETSFQNDQSRSTILNKNAGKHDLFANTETLENIRYSNISSKEPAGLSTPQQFYGHGAGIKHEYSITSQSQPSIIGKDVAYQQTDFNGRQNANKISAPYSSELTNNSSSPLIATRDVTNKFQYNTLNEESRYIYHQSTRTYTLQENHDNKPQEQNKTPQSPSISSVNSPRVANNEEIPISKLNEPNQISSRIQNVENKLPPSVVSSVSYPSPPYNSSYSPLSSNDTKEYFPESEPHISLPKTFPQLTVSSSASNPKLSSKAYGMEASNIELTSQPFYTKTVDSQNLFQSQIVDSRNVVKNAESYSQNRMTSFQEPYRADNKVSPSSHFTSTSNNSDSTFHKDNDQRSAHTFSTVTPNDEKNKTSPEKVTNNPFCSPSSSDQAKSRITNKPDKSPPKIIGEEIPQCHCFPPDQSPPEPGTYYTHLGCANNLRTLRHNFECQTGFTGPAIRIEKVRYTNKEGKTAQGCPIVKWVHRRVNLEEKYLVIVKQRSGHFCQSAFIVIAITVWEGISQNVSNDLYSFLPQHLNKFGIPTKRRCATNDPRTCACQGVNEDSCGSSFTFGCSWSMYYNGCKYTRSKDVRKFRLSVKEEERLIEEKLQNLADQVSPVYKAVAPQSFINQTNFEHVGSECRLGTKPGKPFSGVTACMDFCAHAHKDIHNMNDGCTVVVTLTKHRGLLAKPNEEQYHVLPLFIPDDTDEFGSKENQELKIRTGEIEVLSKYESEIRTFSEPAEKCRNRRDKKEGQRKRKSATAAPSSPSVSSTTVQQTSKDIPSPYNNSEIQSGQVSSTVIDSSLRNSNWRYDNFSSNSENSIGVHSNDNNYLDHLPQFSVFKTPYTYDQGALSNNYSQDGYETNYSSSSNNCPGTNRFHHPTPNLFQHYFNKDTSSSYTVSNPFDDLYLNTTPPPSTGSKNTSEAKPKSVEISYTNNSECFADPAVGGVAIALTHGSILFECAKHELHATTALKTPDRSKPTRLSLVFYQHRSLNKSQHGLDEYLLKQKSKLDSVQSDAVEFDSSFENSSLNSSLEGSSGELAMRTATLPTYSMTTMFPMYPCMVTGPYQEHYDGTLSMPNK